MRRLRREHRQRSLVVAHAGLFKSVDEVGRSTAQAHIARGPSPTRSASSGLAATVSHRRRTPRQFAGEHVGLAGEDFAVPRRSIPRCKDQTGRARAPRSLTSLETRDGSGVDRRVRVGDRRLPAEQRRRRGRHVSVGDRPISASRRVIERLALDGILHLVGGEIVEQARCTSAAVVIELFAHQSPAGWPRAGRLGQESAVACRIEARGRVSCAARSWR